jgi:SAM-dependent methyltransferase
MNSGINHMMSSKELLNKYYNSADHPYRIYENTIHSNLKEDDCILDAGCGRTMPILRAFSNGNRKCIGVDLEECTEPQNNMTYLQNDISKIDLQSDSVDIVISRAVLEHVEYPLTVLKEINRILKVGGKFISLVPNKWDYVSILSSVIPNKYHGHIVSKTEGRKVEDVFPTYYRANSYHLINRLARGSGFEIQRFNYLNQYPSSFMFNPYLFLIGVAYERLTSKIELLNFLRSWILFVLEKKQ